jgi:hypothetical protein
MLPLAIVLMGAAIVLGIFIFPWGGFVLGVIALVLFVAFLFGLGRGKQSPTHDF